MQKRTVVINESTMKALPLELKSLGIESEWQHVIAASVDDCVRLKATMLEWQIVVIVSRSSFCSSLPSR